LGPIGKKGKMGDCFEKNNRKRVGEGGARCLADPWGNLRGKKKKKGHHSRKKKETLAEAYRSQTTLKGGEKNQAHSREEKERSEKRERGKTAVMITVP